MGKIVIQLYLRRPLEDLPELVVPEGYGLRTHTHDDLQAWTKIMSDNGSFGPWPVDRSLPLFGTRSPVVFEGSFFVTHAGEPVATAQLHHQTRRPHAPAAELGWVAVSPAHQGRGLGYVVCLAVLRYAASVGYPEIFLRTEDERLPAIRTYLKLGFEPWMIEPSAPERWRLIHQRLAEYRPGDSDRREPPTGDARGIVRRLPG